MKSYQLRELSDSEILRRIQEEEESLANLRFQKVISQLENPMKLRLTRKDIARMKGILRERQLKKPAAKPEPSAQQKKA